ncbi:MAG: hypothetical protein KGD72_01815 [Candidatus Lokiarchaeota archaeon]|nr:hypothetical protein [Candidatus Lokiarchaeota archaeon]
MGSIPERSNRNIVLIQGFFMISLGIVFNLITNTSSHFPQNLWGWNILVFLGFSQFISYYIFKLVRWARFAVGLSIIFFTPGIREMLFLGKDMNPIIDILYFIIVSPLPNFSLLPYASISVFSTVFGEFIYESITLNSSSANLHSTSSILKYGAFLLICGLLLPFIDVGFIITGDNFDPITYPFIDAIPILKAFPTTFVSGIPIFLYAGTPSNLFISMGVALLVIGRKYYRKDVLQKNKLKLNVISLFGKSSITLFFLQFIFLPLFYQKLLLLIFIPLLIAYIILLGIFLHLWQKYGNSIPSFDWMLNKIDESLKK